MFKEGARILGLKNPSDFYPHSLRLEFITRLANDSSVNDEERMRSARHNSVQASEVYQKRSSVSEMSKLKALGVVRYVQKKFPKLIKKKLFFTYILFSFYLCILNIKHTFG